MEITSMDILNYIDSIPFVLVFAFIGIGMVLGFAVYAVVTVADYYWELLLDRKKSRKKSKDTKPME